MQTLQQKISKLWAASFNLEHAAKSALAHLPDEQAEQLSRELHRFRMTVDNIRKS